MTDTDDLVSWLRTQLDDDEAWARACIHAGESEEGRWQFGIVYGTVMEVTCKRRTTIASTPSQVYAEHIARHDPTWVLADIAAKRAILDLHYIIERKVNWVDDEGDDRQSHLPVCEACVPKYSHLESLSRTGPCQTVRLLATAYADRPGYLDQWKP